VFKMNKKIRKSWIALMAIVLLAGVVTGGSAALGSSPAPVLASAPPVTQALPAGALTSMFGALRTPAASVADIPSVVQGQFTRSDPIRRFGIDLADLHTVGPPDHQFYVGSGPGGLCVILPDPDGSSFCTADLAGLRKLGVEMQEVPPSTGAGTDDVRPIDPGASIVTYGIAPDGVTSVQGQTSSGNTANTALANNAYVLVTKTPVWRLTFHTSSGSWSNN
jgi:hypothetical protein